MHSHSQAYFLSAAVWAINRLDNRLDNWLDSRLDNWFNNWLDNWLQECLHVTACCTTGSVQTRTPAVSAVQLTAGTRSCVGQYLLHTGRTLSSKPADRRVAAVDRWDRQTDRQTDEYGARRLTAGKNICEAMTYVDAADYCADVARVLAQLDDDELDRPSVKLSRSQRDRRKAGIYRHIGLAYV